MYLKEIKMVGFKSFAEKTSIEFDKGITGIVGPNGSGKSNIVDAVRWVLGEQSIKSLRGDDSMTDIIFSGSKSRNPLNIASVTLVFDNSDKHLPISYEEVSIKRTIYKSGENEYTLNNEKCRLKDITDLLLDSGSSKEAFNIISQGKIQEILSNRPEERRIIFEEAAGVLKYKKRKEEAIRKLDRTHANMTRVKDIIGELAISVAPLKEQSEIATKYLQLKKELESIEISLITSDIANINYDYQNSLKLIEEINLELTTLATSSSNEEATLQLKKFDLQKLEREMQIVNQNLIKTTTEAEQLNSDKKIIIERQKYKVDDQKLHNNLILLKEQQLKLKNQLTASALEIESKSQELVSVNGRLLEESTVINKLKEAKINLEIKINENVKQHSSLTYNIERLSESIENNADMPYGVKAVLNNPKLNGVHNVIGKLIDTKEVYATALDIALGATKEFIVVENEKAAKDSIFYLKSNNLGRATFFPISIIQSRQIEDSFLVDAKKHKGFIDIASNLVTYDDKYKNIILNQLGTTLIVEDLTSANEISKTINHRFKIVSLEGDLIHVGGSLTGGSLRRKPGMIKEKYELEHLVKDKETASQTIKKQEQDLLTMAAKYTGLEDKLNETLQNKFAIEQVISSQTDTKNSTEKELEEIVKELSGTNKTLEDTLTQEEVKVMDKFYEKEQERNNLAKQAEDFNKLKSDLQETICDLETYIRKENTTYSKKNEELKTLEIKTTRMDVKLDSLLNTLSEDYSMTFDHAKELYKLDIKDTIARPLVNSLKSEIKNLGVVNIGAIEEYERVNKRFEFLTTQQTELENAETILLEIITEMDDIMKDQFVETFDMIKEQFKETFKDLFNGGTASLKMTDPNNVLETGIEIIASPPGKKLTTISLLSGGEKSLTAIALLFSILKVRPVPYCLLDEVEAALDEVNVDKFGQHLETFRKETQFIIITHKKKTMEYVDSLYGITMPESGVSKLVSVRLEEKKN